MANGYYACGTAVGEDCQSQPAAYDNSGTYAVIGQSGGVVNRHWLRFPLDIPAGATIDHAYLYVYNNATASTPGNPNVNLVDDNDCNVFDANPHARTLCSTGNGAAIAWGAFSGATTWQKSADIAAQVGYFVGGNCTGGGYAANQYIGFALTADGAANDNYHQVCQSQSADLGAFLVVAWTKAGGKCTKIAVVAGTDDDTYNASTDTTEDRTATLYVQFGQVGKSGPKNRGFLRFNAGVPKSATVDAAVLVGCASSDNGDSVAFNAGIQCLDTESTFTGNVYARAVIGGTATTWAVATGTWGALAKKVTSDFAARISDRITQADYDPAGAGDYPYIGVRIDYGDAAADYESRTLYAYDSSAAAFKPILVIAYEDVPAGVSITAPALEGSLDVPTPTVAAGVALTVPALEGALDIAIPAIAAGVAVTAPVVEGTLDVPVPAVAAGANVTAPALDGNLDVPAPTIASGVAITAPVVDGNLDIPVPAIASGAAVTAPVVGGTLDIPVPTVAAGANITAPAIDGTLDIPVPAIASGVAITVPALDGFLDVPVPTISAGAAITVPAIEGTLDIPVPGMNIVGPFLGTIIQISGQVIDQLTTTGVIPEYKITGEALDQSDVAGVVKDKHDIAGEARDLIDIEGEI